MYQFQQSMMNSRTVQDQNRGLGLRDNLNVRQVGNL